MRMSSSSLRSHLRVFQQLGPGRPARTRLERQLVGDGQRLRREERDVDGGAARDRRFRGDSRSLQEAPRSTSSTLTARFGATRACAAATTRALAGSCSTTTRARLRSLPAARAYDQHRLARVFAGENECLMPSTISAYELMGQDTRWAAAAQRYGWRPEGGSTEPVHGAHEAIRIRVSRASSLLETWSRTRDGQVALHQPGG
jgi:hypothetical protein